MFKVRFHTNLDLVSGDKDQWPDLLPFRPMVGDRIVSPYIHTTYEGASYQLELEVHAVKIVVQNKEGWPVGSFSHFEVELNLPKSGWFSSLRDFYNHYEKITGQKFI